MEKGVILENSSPENSKLRRAFELKGVVQGVGFRPYVYSLAQRYSLQGWVKNSSAGVYLEVEGPPQVIEQFSEQLPLQALCDILRTYPHHLHFPDCLSKRLFL